ncbi:hypothetical protein J41TS12_13730 [Paenibacillus antibioticophila]|uniref:Uncharacterized protein n=1 Tax=Paenibacillus antibioticophila TaxID=1274374 RepID=A0A919XNX5_9BACL|nr:hypothetical protein J41TS12_13730 [Paenibacillus antibioticophila]
MQSEMYALTFYNFLIKEVIVRCGANMLRDKSNAGKEGNRSSAQVNELQSNKTI